MSKKLVILVGGEKDRLDEFIAERLPGYTKAATIAGAKIAREADYVGLVAVKDPVNSGITLFNYGDWADAGFDVEILSFPRDDWKPKQEADKSLLYIDNPDEGIEVYAFSETADSWKGSQYTELSQGEISRYLTIGEVLPLLEDGKPYWLK